VNKALFLDRDGTIIEDRGYLADPEGVLLLAGAAEALRELHSEGWQLVVVSNQSGVGRGFITRDQMDAVQTRFLETMEEHGVSIAASYLCVHSPEENCECRKPLPFFLKQASREHSIDLSASWMIGDREGDILCGRNAGCSTIWLRNELFAVPEDLAAFTAENWEEIYRKVSASH
jgi:histidinol-phosphate phosphatase family protein